MSDQLKPPSAASRLLSWIRDPYLPEILGDLDEEFGVRARSLGAAAARRWYWRETLRNAWFLLRRKRIVGTTVIAFFAVLSVRILFATLASIAWSMWMSAVQWPGQYRPLLYQLSWKMGWPGAYTFEILCAPIVGLAVGYLFALAAPDRARHMRIAAALLWLLNGVWFTLWVFAVVHPYGRFIPTITVGMKQRLLFEFLAREVTAAGAFFVGAGIVMARRRPAITQYSWLCRRTCGN